MVCDACSSVFPTGARPLRPELGERPHLVFVQAMRQRRQLNLGHGHNLYTHAAVNGRQRSGSRRDSGNVRSRWPSDIVTGIFGGPRAAPRARRWRRRRERGSRRLGRFPATSTRSSSTSAGREVAKCKTPVASSPPAASAARSWRPYSDSDLLVLCPKTPGPGCPDAGASRSSTRCGTPRSMPGMPCGRSPGAGLAASDLAAATALLDARFLTGTRGWPPTSWPVPQAGREDGTPGLRGASAGRAGGPALALRRHHLLLEPDLKNGPGGIRDLCVGRWAAHGPLPGPRIPEELLAKGVMTGVWRRRSSQRPSGCCASGAMHARPAAGRITCASRCRSESRRCPPRRAGHEGVIRPAVHPAVEALMHQSHAHATSSTRPSDSCSGRPARRARGPTRPVPLDGGTV